MELSQDRTRAVMNYALTLPKVLQYNNWFIAHVTANGLSSSRPILDTETGEIDMDLSRRVEFRIKTKTRERLLQIESEINEAQR